MDELYPQAEWLVNTEREFGMSTLQRHLLIGYNRASRIMDDLIKNGVVEQFNATNGIGYRKTPNAEVRGCANAEQPNGDQRHE